LERVGALSDQEVDVGKSTVERNRDLWEVVRLKDLNDCSNEDEGLVRCFARGSLGFERNGHFDEISSAHHIG
jgi:hypothetical protein